MTTKDDEKRYRALLLLQSRSAFSADVYPYWDTFRSKLQSRNSYQRGIGLMLLAENRMEAALDEYLELLHDEKTITIRHCIQGLGKIAAEKPRLAGRIAARLVCFDPMGVRESMRKSILLDILRVLCSIKVRHQTAEIEGFIAKALTGGVLDKGSKGEIENLLQQA